MNVLALHKIIMKTQDYTGWNNEGLHILCR